MALAVLSEVVLEQEVEDCIVLADIGAVLFVAPDLLLSAGQGHLIGVSLLRLNGICITLVTRWARIMSWSVCCVPR